MASKKRRVEDDETPSESHAKKERVAHEKYESAITMRGTPEEKRKYKDYLKEHQKKLRRLQREANGEFVPGDYDASY